MQKTRCRWCKPYPLAHFINQELVRVVRRHNHRKCVELSGEDITEEFNQEVADGERAKRSAAREHAA
jgi:hypothetical protein